MCLFSVTYMIVLVSAISCSQALFMLIMSYVCSMYQFTLALLVAALCVDSLTMYGTRNVNVLVFNMFDREEGGNSSSSEPPPHSEIAKMARYIVHNSGKNLS
jgi:hypothetical protein